jgi:hypothetical protein
MRFFTCDTPHPGRPKTLTNPEIIDQIHELILGDLRISAKSIAEQLGFSRQSFRNIWTCGGSPRSESRNAWTLIKNVNGASRLSNFGFFGGDPNDFLLRPVTMDENWLYPEAKHQSMDWRHSGLPRPKKFRVQKSASFCFAMKTLSSSLIIFERAKLSPRIITHLCWCN